MIRPRRQPRDENMKTSRRAFCAHMSGWKESEEKCTSGMKSQMNMPAARAEGKKERKCRACRMRRDAAQRINI